jgi:hypothetical protein
LQRWLVGIAGWLAFSSANALAQEASSLEQLQMLVKPDDTIAVIDASGNQTTGRISALSSSSLRLLVRGVPREFQPSEILEIRQRRADSLVNGAIIGAIAGAGFGTIGAIIFCLEEPCGASAVGIVGAYAAMGTGIAVGIDALIIRQKTIYRAPQRSVLSRFHIAPILSTRRKGLSLSFSF